MGLVSKVHNLQKCSYKDIDNALYRYTNFRDLHYIYIAGGR